VVYASLSSLVATLGDGLAYQMSLTRSVFGYGLAAFIGAGVGGLLNFLLNRYWTFRATARSLFGQSVLYVVGSVLTFVILRVSLWVLIERAGFGERMAWFPAKAIAWVGMSYPFQRWVVFARERR
jgi:putative flippase GtrA